MARIFQSLETETRPTVDTETAAHYLNYATQTLRYWSHSGKGPLQPVRITGSNKLQWRTSELRDLLGVVV